MNAIMTIIGRLGGDPKNSVVGDQEKAFASLGVSREYKKQGAQYPETDWFSFEVWGKKATALMQHGKKGKPLMVTGRPEFYTDKEGKERMVIRQATWSFVPSDSSARDGYDRNHQDGFSEAPDDGDIPF